MGTPCGLHTYDAIVIGGGVAGLFTALKAAESGSVLVLAKERLSESNSSRAQGGIAVAMRDDDAPSLHALDTLAAGADFAHSESIRLLTEEAPKQIADLINFGVSFDRLPGGDTLAWGREGAHRLPRILHAGGDATGARIVETLVAAVRAHPQIELMEARTAVSIFMESGAARGVYHIASWTESAPQLVRGRFIVLATGGAGQLFARTTNPPIATGDGLLLGYRAGATLADIEMFQFHPTALALPDAPAFLLSEAMRGEGGVLRNAAGERFVAKYHRDGELAPRDVVSRAIVAELAATGDPAAFLDVTHLPADKVRTRFPTIERECRRFDLDITADPIPVTPAAHYFMGGVWTNLWGQTTVPGLFACGEVACTGVHGANRLASNSLLEALVFGGRTAEAMRRLEGWPDRDRWDVSDPSHSFLIAPTQPAPDEAKSHVDDGATTLGPVVLSGPDASHISRMSREAIQQLAWQNLGPERSEDGLNATLQALRDDVNPRAENEARRLDATVTHPKNRSEAERQALALIAELMARAALTRRESRGAHYRSDCPAPRPEWRRHILVKATHDGNDDTQRGD